MTYIINTLENLVFIILAVVVLGFLFGDVGVWWGLVIGEVIAILATLVIIAIKKRRLPRTFDDLQVLSPLFGMMAENMREWTATDLDQMKTVSSEARAYMLSQGAPEADAVLVAESMEEMGEYGYTMEMNYFMAII